MAKKKFTEDELRERRRSQDQVRKARDRAAARQAKGLPPAKPCPPSQLRPLRERNALADRAMFLMRGVEAKEGRKKRHEHQMNPVFRRKFDELQERHLRDTASLILTQLGLTERQIAARFGAKSAAAIRRAGVSDVFLCELPKLMCASDFRALVKRSLTNAMTRLDGKDLGESARHEMRRFKAETAATRAKFAPKT